MIVALEVDQWASNGPAGIPLMNNDVMSGQLATVAVHPNNADVLYVGAADGGVWKTSDGGVRWTPVTDFKLTRALPSGERKGTSSVGALAIDPSAPEVVYVGTGNPNVAFGGFFAPGLGVFRSRDGGLSWTPLGVDLSQAGCANADMSQAVVDRIVLQPGTPGSVFAATNRGLFKYEEDGRDCWRRLTDGLPPGGPPGPSFIDLVMDGSSLELYAGITGSGVFKTIDAAGERWQQLTTGLPASGFGRIALAIARPGQAHVVYAGFDANGRYRLFKSTSHGAAWDELPSPPSESWYPCGDATQA